MKRLRFPMILAVLAVALTPFPSGADTIAETEGRGLRVQSSPPGASVYIDGVERGVTPLELRDLPGGTYSLRLRKEGFAERRLSVTVLSSSRMALSLDLEPARGAVVLEVRRSEGSPPEERLPLQPEILADGERVTEPVIILAAGFRTIRARAFGWEEAGETVFVEEGSLRRVVLEMRIAAFTLEGFSARRRSFNPGNPGSLGMTELAFTVSAPGRAVLRITGDQGEAVFSEELPPFETWSQSVTWNGRTASGAILPDGVYTARIEARPLAWDGEETAAVLAETAITIDSGLVIRGRSLAAGKSGLFFAALPDALPPRSFQVEGTALFGRPALTGPPWSSLPFAAAFRFSPLKALELSAALNGLPEFSGPPVWGAGLSAKWAFSGPSSPLGLAAGLSYGWAQSGSLSPFGMGSGAELFFPVSWNFLENFSLALVPGLIWTGEKGYPNEAAPRILVSGGFLFQRGPVSAALSARGEFAAAGENRGAGPLLTAAELRFLHPASGFVYSLLGGFWLKNRETGAFGGLGIGLLY